jgi:hypothetical protein
VAFEFHVGVQIATGVPPAYSNPTNWGNNLDQDWVGPDPTDKYVGAIRMIVFQGSDTPAQVAAWVDAMQARGFYVIITLAPPSQAWANSTQTLAAWQTQVTNFVAGPDAASPDVWSIGNEPGAKPAQPTNGAGSNGPYWAKFKAAADIIHAETNIPVALGAPIHAESTHFYNNANAQGVLPYLDMWDTHVYGDTPAASLTAVQNRRAQVNAFSPSWSAKTMLITEFGWSVKKGAGTFANMVVPSGAATDTTAGTQAGNLYVAFDNWRDNREALKLRAACWYQAFDSGWMNTQNGWCGLIKDHRTDICGPAAIVGQEAKYRGPCPPSTGANHWTASNPTVARRPAYHRLRTLPFPSTTDAPVVPVTPPEVFTDAATNVAQTTAGLKGRVDPNNLPCTRYFDWGLSPSSLTNSSPGVTVTGDTQVNVGHIATPLPSNTRIYFRVRVVAGSGVGTVNGTTRFFDTLAPPLAPTVNNGSSTNVTPTGVVLNGLIDPNGLDVSDYHFEYWTTGGGVISLYPSSAVYPTSSIYPGGAVGAGGSTFSTTPGTLSGTASLTSVSATLTDLEPNTIYFWRLVASNSAGTTTGVPDLQFRTGALQGEGPLTTVARPKLPSLAISVEIATVDGRTFRWDDRSKNPRERPYELTFSTAAGDGFADASCILYRPIGLDYPDLRLLARGRFIGSDAQVVYDGRVSGLPRTVDSSGEAIQVQFQGLMAASGKDRPFMEVYADRSGDRWQEASLNYRVEMANSNTLLDTDYTASQDTGSISFRGTTQKVIPVSSQGVLMWQAPSGVKAKKFQYKGQQHNIQVNGLEDALLFANDTDTTNMGSWDSYALTMDSTIRSATLTTGRSFLGLRLRAGGGHTPSATEGAKRIFRQLCVYGDHDVALQDNGTEPDGVYASDVLRDIVDRFCPYLDASEIDDTSAILEHLVFDSPTMPFDAFTHLNGFHQWLLGAYEDGKVIFRPADLTRTDWIVDTDADGIDLTLQGEAIDGGVANGMPVAYTDVSERQVVLWPDQHVELRDDDPDHPANQEGIKRWPFVLELSNKATKAMALRLGEVALEELNRAKRPGTVTVQGGYVLDQKENPRPAHEVRYGQTLAFGNLPNISRPHLITATSWNQDGSLSVTLEQPPTRVDAVMARLELAHSVSGTT